MLFNSNLVLLLNCVNVWGENRLIYLVGMCGKLQLNSDSLFFLKSWRRTNCEQCDSNFIWEVIELVQTNGVRFYDFLLNYCLVGLAG